MKKTQPHNLYLTLQQTTLCHAYKTAFVCDGHQYSYQSFLNSVDLAGNILCEHFQLSKGDIIVLALGNRPEFCTLFYAAMSQGIIVVPLSTKLRKEDGQTILDSVEAKVVFYEDDQQNWIIKCKQNKSLSLNEWRFLFRNFDNKNNKIQCDKVNKNDIAAIIYTSGTTGSPKGAVITHGNFLAAASAYHDVLGLTANDSSVLAIPICSITGLSALLCLFVYIGGTLHLHHRFSAEHILQAVSKNKITFIHGSPTVFILLTQEMQRQQDKYDCSSLRMIACGAGHLNIGTINDINGLFPSAEIRPIYGLTETTSPASIFPSDVRTSKKIGSSGLFLKSVKHQITDDNGNILSAGETGHLWLKGAVVISHYWKNEQANKKIFKNGWMYTGDIAAVDEDGYLFIKDRSKDMINRGGEKIYSIEIENLISSYPGVKDVAIVPYKDELYGEVPIAFIVSHKDFPLVSANIMYWLSSKIAKYKMPSKIVFLLELPKNSNGKTNKLMLRDLLCNNNFKTIN